MTVIQYVISTDDTSFLFVLCKGSTQRELLAKDLLNKRVV